MRTIDVDELKEALLEARRSETDTVPKLIRLIDAQPTIEPKRGRWIDEHESGHGAWVGKCSCCGHENRVDNYCPNCGARMEEDE